MSHKSITQQSYQDTALEFTKNVETLVPFDSIEKFIRLLPSKGRIIDLGCGSGRDAKIFSEKGFSVTGVDFCQNLIEIAKAQAPLAKFQIADIESVEFPDSYFDGAWAGCTLNHIQKKNLPNVLRKIHGFLKDQGHFYLTLKKGIGEVLEKDLRYGEFEKFWAFAEENEIKKLLESLNFNILECEIVKKKHAYHTHDAIRIFCKKN